MSICNYICDSIKSPVCCAYNFVKDKVDRAPIRRDYVKHSNKIKNLRSKVEKIAIIKGNLEQEMRTESHALPLLSFRRKEDTIEKIKLINDRIEKLLKNIENENAKFSTTIAGKIISKVSNISLSGYSVCEIVKNKIPIYGEYVKYSNKMKNLRSRIEVISSFKKKLEQTIRGESSLLPNLSPHKKEVSIQNIKAINDRIDVIRKRIEKLHKKIESESAKFSITIAGQIMGKIGNVLIPGSGALAAGTTAAFKAAYHNSQASDSAEVPKSIALEVSKAFASSIVGDQVSGIIKDSASIVGTHVNDILKEFSLETPT